MPLRVLRGTGRLGLLKNPEAQEIEVHYSGKQSRLADLYVYEEAFDLISEAMYIHPTVSELFSTMLQEMIPLE